MMKKVIRDQEFVIKLERFKKEGVLPKAVKHGHALAATKYKCTCALCVRYKESRRTKAFQNKSKYKEYFKIHGRLPDQLNHGSSGYGIGCRCELCVSNHKEHSKERDKKSLDKFKKQFKEDISFKSIGVKHGLRGYAIGCRCSVCKSTHKIQNQKQLEEQRKYLVENGKFLNPRTKHGTHVALKYGCRCEICLNFSKDYSNNYREGGEYQMQQKNNRQHLLETGAFLSPHTKHGTLSGYNIGCRCTECKITTACYLKKRRNKLK